MADDTYFNYPEEVNTFGFDLGQAVADGGARGQRRQPVFGRCRRP